MKVMPVKPSIAQFMIEVANDEVRRRKISLLADRVFMNDRGFCHAANCAFCYLGVSSPVGRIFDRICNTGHYPGVMLLDLIPVEDWRYRCRILPSPASLDAMAAAARLAKRSRRKAPLPEDVREVVRGWLLERRDAMHDAGRIGLEAGYTSLARWGGREADRTGKALELLER